MSPKGPRRSEFASDAPIIDHDGGVRPGQEATRLAPSPTGALHLGNVRTFLLTWAIARRRGWRIVMRIEDLDGPRVKPGADREAIDTISRLGMDWDVGPLVQSSDLSPYIAAMHALAAKRLVYPCELTRTQIEAAASAPHGEESHEIRFPVELRPAPPDRPERFTDEGTNWRLALPDEEVAHEDAFAGRQAHHPLRSIGDIVVWTKRREPAYQLAVVVDDHRQGVTQVIRGDDLLPSAARQILVYRALGLEPAPEYTHVPLVVGADGRRLAKRHGDTRISHYFAAGVRPERLIGLMAAWCGLERREMSAAEFAAAVDLGRIPRSPVVFGPEDDQWLLSR